MANSLLNDFLKALCQSTLAVITKKTYAHAIMKSTLTETKEERIMDTTLPSKTHISFKAQEKNLLLMEAELMNFYSMNRSDLHKHFIRNAYNLLKSPSY